MQLQGIILICFLMTHASAHTALKCATAGQNTLKFSIRNKLNNTGKWVAQVQVEDMGHNKQFGPLDVDVEHTSIKCDGSESTLIVATISEPSYSMPGYELVPGLGYYKYHTDVQSWHAARVMCNKEGAHLAILNSHFEFSVMKTLMDRHPNITNDWRDNFAFLGVSDLETPKNFVTIFGRPISETGYTNWHPREPDDSGHCVDLKVDGTLHDTSCDTKMPYICERELYG